MTTVAVIGPGAIGGTLAAWLCETKRHDVTVCARTPLSQLEVAIPEGRTLSFTPRVLTDPSDAREVEWVVAVTKTYDVEGAAAWLRALVGSRTRVAVVQNGVEHRERFGAVVPRDRVLPVIIDIPAERSAPGKIIQRRHGDITVPAGDLGRSFAALFEGTPLAPILSDDFLSASWRKLALNSAGVVHALTLKPARVVQHEKAAALMRAIVEETIAVGRAVGAKLSDTLASEVLDRLRASAPESRNSLLVDRLAGRPLEIDARNGVIVRLGEKHGIPTPLNRMAVAILEAAIA